MERIGFSAHFFYRNLMRQGALTCMKIRSRCPADGEAMV